MFECRGQPFPCKGNTCELNKKMEIFSWWFLANSVISNNNGNNKITELRTILQRESQNS
jgi:hypothetical protein